MIAYTEGYKYQLQTDYRVRVDIRPLMDIKTRFIDLTVDGDLTIYAGYAWDGPSGPTVDTKNFMRGSLVHDALYQLMREEHLDHAARRQVADAELRRLCREDGMGRARAWFVYNAVRIFGDPAADPKHNKPTLFAP